MPYVFFKNLKNRDLWAKLFRIDSNFTILLWFLINLINDDAFVSAATANACFMVHLVCLFMETNLLALLQDNCLDLVRCAFLQVVWMREEYNSVLSTPTEANKIGPIPIYRRNSNIGPIYRSISRNNDQTRIACIWHPSTNAT